ncbi:hypothetical protein LINPERPRIM_LOCUS27621 [Linum perenne]
MCIRDREVNCAADYLANLVHSCSIGLHIFTSPDSSLAHWFRYDLIEVVVPRAISINN